LPQDIRRDVQQFYSNKVLEKMNIFTICSKLPTKRKKEEIRFVISYLTHNFEVFRGF
jgi:hypothetical protein